MRQDKIIQDVNSVPTSKGRHGDLKDHKNEDEKTAPGSGQTPSTRPLNVMYVAGRGKDSTSHHAMGVDPPAISKVMTSKAKHSGFGVDAPRLVDQPLDPRVHRTGSLHVDGNHEPVHPLDDGHNIHVPHHHHDPGAEGGDHVAPIQTSKNKVIHGNVHHQTGNTLPEARAAIGKNPFEAHMSHHRGPNSSGMNVDHAVIPTSALAGSGSSDNTNHNRPSGTYNSGINVDKAGSPDHKRTGMGVDDPATTTHHMASAHGHGHFHLFGKRKTAAEDPKHHPEGDHESLVDKVKHVFHRHGHTKSDSHTTSAATHAATPRVSSSSRSSSIPPTVIPSGHEGPIPQMGPGDKVVHAKGIGHNGDDQNEDIAAAAATDVHREFNQSNHHGRTKSLWNRIRGRHSPVDKGKQREQRV